MSSEEIKKAVGTYAAQHVESGMLLGLGTGSTAKYYIEELGRKVNDGSLKNIKAVSSSYSTTLLAEQCNIPLLPLDLVSELDFYVDGADEVDPTKRLIKGRGGAMLREKIIATCSREFWVIVEESKLVDQLGTSFPVPIEVLPLALKLVWKKVEALGGPAKLRMAERKDGPVVTDGGNLILDVQYPTHLDFDHLNQEINQIPGVIGHGIFVGLATKIIAGGSSGVRKID